MSLFRQRLTAGCLLLLLLSSLLLLLLEQQQKTKWTITVHGLSSVAVQDRRSPPPNVVVYYDASQALHRDLYYHPEQPARIAKCLAAIRGSAAWLQPPTTEDGAAVTRRIRLVDCAPDHGDDDDPQHDDGSSSLSSSTTSTPEPVRSSQQQQEPGKQQRRPITAAELEYAEYLLRQIHASDLVQNLQEKSRQAQARRRADGKASALGHVSLCRGEKSWSPLCYCCCYCCCCCYHRYYCDENSPVPAKTTRKNTRFPIHSFFLHMGYIDADTYVTTASYDVCLRAMAIWVRAVDDAVAAAACVMDDDADDATSPTVSYTLALTRPPGHHATYDSSNGFCLYNFAAAAAFHAVMTSGTIMTNNGHQQQQRARCRVAILDWDVHYGQGVADIVGRQRQQQRDNGHDGPMTAEEEPWQNHVRYASIHQTPAFPYQGEIRQTVGNVRTIPVPPETTWTCGYEDAFTDALDFLLCGGVDDDDSSWHPDVVIVCAGYDALAGTSLTQDDYYRMTRLLCERLLLKQQSTTTGRRRPVKLMLGLEGGYQLGDDCGPSGNFPQALVRTLEALLETA